MPLRQGRKATFRPYNCQTGTLGDKIELEPQPVAVIEGSYSCHPELWDFYDLHVFCTIHPSEQLRRIRKRNGEAALSAFQAKWIPLEEQYFQAFRLSERCELCFCMET